MTLLGNHEVLFLNFVKNQKKHICGLKFSFFREEKVGKKIIFGRKKGKISIDKIKEDFYNLFFLHRLK